MNCHNFKVEFYEEDANFQVEFGDDGSEFQTSFNDSISINLNHNHDDRYEPLGAAEAAAQEALTEAKNYSNEQIDEVKIYVDDQILKGKEYTDNQSEIVKAYSNELVDKANQQLTVYVDQQAAGAKKYTNEQITLVTNHINKQAENTKTYVDESVNELRSYTNEKIDITKEEIVAGAQDKHNTLEKLGSLIEANERQIQGLKESVAYDWEVSENYETKTNVEQKINETKRYVDNALESLEIPEVDLSNYYNKQEINEALREKANQSALDELTENVDQLEEAFKNIDGFGAQADWDQNDETAQDYVKNRTHWVEKGFIEIVNTTVNYDAYEEGYLVAFTGEKNPAVGDVYTVSINGDAAQEFTLDDTLVFDYVCSTNGKTYTFNFGLGWTDIYIFASDGSSDSFDLVMNASGEIYHTIDAKFIPDDIHMQLETAQTAAADALSIANIAKDTVDGKMEAKNPVGTGTFSMGRKSGTISGTKSFAVGSNVTASGNYSYAIGRATIASGGTSYAEGWGTMAIGGGSHAEGRSTIANGDYSHVQGKFNIADDTDTYAHIVGNGESDTIRSNAHTLDWSGNAWFAGDVYVGGMDQDDEVAERLLKESDLPSEFDALKLLAEMNMVEPVSANDGSVYTDENGAVYSL